MIYSDKEGVNILLKKHQLEISNLDIKCESQNSQLKHELLKMPYTNIYVYLKNKVIIGRYLKNGRREIESELYTFDYKVKKVVEGVVENPSINERKISSLQLEHCYYVIGKNKITIITVANEGNGEIWPTYDLNYNIKSVYSIPCSKMEEINLKLTRNNRIWGIILKVKISKNKFEYFHFQNSYEELIPLKFNFINTIQNSENEYKNSLDILMIYDDKNDLEKITLVTYVTIDKFDYLIFWDMKKHYQNKNEDIRIIQNTNDDIYSHINYAITDTDRDYLLDKNYSNNNTKHETILKDSMNMNLMNSSLKFDSVNLLLNKSISINKTLNIKQNKSNIILNMISKIDFKGKNISKASPVFNEKNELKSIVLYSKNFEKLYILNITLLLTEKNCLNFDNVLDFCILQHYNKLHQDRIAILSATIVTYKTIQCKFNAENKSLIIHNKKNLYNYGDFYITIYNGKYILYKQKLLLKDKLPLFMLPRYEYLYIDNVNKSCFIYFLDYEELNRSIKTFLLVSRNYYNNLNFKFYKKFQNFLCYETIYDFENNEIFQNLIFDKFIYYLWKYIKLLLKTDINISTNDINQCINDIRINGLMLPNKFIDEIDFDINIELYEISKILQETINLFYLDCSLQKSSLLKFEWLLKIILNNLKDNKKIITNNKSFFDIFKLINDNTKDQLKELINDKITIYNKKQYISFPLRIIYECYYNTKKENNNKIKLLKSKSYFKYIENNNLNHLENICLVNFHKRPNYLYKTFRHFNWSNPTIIPKTQDVYKKEEEELNNIRISLRTTSESFLEQKEFEIFWNTVQHTFHLHKYLAKSIGLTFFDYNCHYDYPKPENNTEIDEFEDPNIKNINSLQNDYILLPEHKMCLKCFYDIRDGISRYKLHIQVKYYDQTSFEWAKFHNGVARAFNFMTLRNPILHYYFNKSLNNNLNFHTYLKGDSLTMNYIFNHLIPTMMTSEGSGFLLGCGIFGLLYEAPLLFPNFILEFFQKQGSLAISAMLIGLASSHIGILSFKSFSKLSQRLLKIYSIFIDFSSFKINDKILNSNSIQNFNQLSNSNPLLDVDMLNFFDHTPDQYNEIEEIDNVISFHPLNRSAALVGIGILAISSANKILSSEIQKIMLLLYSLSISKRPNKSQLTFESLKGYLNWDDIKGSYQKIITQSCGISLGLILLGKGHSECSQLLRDAFTKTMLNIDGHNYKYAISIALCFTLINLNSQNEELASFYHICDFNIDQSLKILFYKPKTIILFYWCRYLILSDTINCTSDDWIFKNLNENFIELYWSFNKHDEFFKCYFTNYCDIIHLQATWCIIIGCCYALAFKYCATANKDAFNIIYNFYKVIIILINNFENYFDESKYHLIIKNLKTFSLILLLSLSIIYAGTCDKFLKRIITFVLKCTETNPSMSILNVFQNSDHLLTSAIGTRGHEDFNILYTCLGILCLGNGNETFSISTLEQYAMLIISLIPDFPSHPYLDSDIFHSLRHLWSFATTKTRFLKIKQRHQSCTYFSNSDIISTCNIVIYLKNSQVLKSIYYNSDKEHYLLPELNNIAEIRINGFFIQTFCLDYNTIQKYIQHLKTNSLNIPLIVYADLIKLSNFYHLSNTMQFPFTYSQKNIIGSCLNKATQRFSISNQNLIYHYCNKNTPVSKKIQYYLLLQQFKTFNGNSSFLLNEIAMEAFQHDEHWLIDLIMEYWKFKKAIQNNNQDNKHLYYKRIINILSFNINFDQINIFYKLSQSHVMLIESFLNYILSDVNNNK